MNNVKLLHIKCYFSQFFNSLVALKNNKKIGPPKKVEMTPLPCSNECYQSHLIYAAVQSREKLAMIDSNTETRTRVARTKVRQCLIRTELHWLDIKTNFQVVRTRISMPPCVCSVQSCLLLYTGQCHRWTLISPICSVGSVIRAENQFFDNFPFAISYPSAWNCLPVDLRDPDHSLLIFRRKLKTNLFNLSVQPTSNLFYSDELFIDWPACCGLLLLFLILLLGYFSCWRTVSSF